MGRVDHGKAILGLLFPGRRHTRTEIADALGLRKSTVGELCAELLRGGRLAGDESIKRNARLWLEPSAFVSVGVQHKVDCLKLLAMNAGLEVRARRSVPMQGVFEQARVDSILQAVSEFVRDECGGPVLGVGFSDFIPHDIGPGPGARARSIWMPGWNNVNIKAMIEGTLGLDTEIMRCTDAFSFAEQVFGACGNTPAFITVQLDEGIGVSVFKNHGFLKGSTDIFGELGHTVYREDGEICRCGNRGCLETVAGVEAIIKKVKDNVRRGTYFRFAGDLESLQLEDVIGSAREGNKLALLSINEAAKAVGDTLAVVVTVLGITRVVLYGRLAQAGELLLQQVRNSIRQHCIYPLNEDTEVCLSELDEYGSAMGAAYAVLRSYFQERPLRV